MATRKGIDISRNYAALHKLYAFFVLCFVFKKMERSDKVVSYIILKTQ